MHLVFQFILINKGYCLTVKYPASVTLLCHMFLMIIFEGNWKNCVHMSWKINVGIFDILISVSVGRYSTVGSIKKLNRCNVWLRYFVYIAPVIQH